jgi:CRP-like cAMP-binding protein
MCISLQKTDFFSPALDYLSFRRIRGKVAGVLLDSTGDGAGGRPVLTLGEIAASIDTTPEMVNKSLESLQEKGAIRLEHRRIVVNRELLRKMAAHRTHEKDNYSG